jgi:osmotically-inducible protein OsmY
MTSIEMWLSQADETKTQRELQDRLWDELHHEPCLDAHGLVLEVTDYVATLGGSVMSYAEKLAAERAAQRVPGIAGVVNEIAVVLPAREQRGDEALASMVARALEWDVFVPGERVTAQVVNGSVTLEGQVDWPYQRAAAEEAVQRLRGVRDAINHVTVVPRAVPADVLRSRLEAALQHAPLLHARRIRAETRGGTVVLHGHVRSLAERSEAEQVARAIPGVTAVEDELTVEH